MGEEIVISLKNISKCYKRYARPVDRLKETLLPGKSHAQEFWALRDINLEITKGEKLGIIGQNGSGKSTLLQIIARTLTPTTGDVWLHGRVSALLELGSGFNPEFTGRQNVFFNGQILGLSREEIEAKYNEIVEFADIGDFIEQPVKTYSSGMFVRLAFAVAVSVDPDILIVDEALAVGDIYFQQKCFERIRNLTRMGTTLLFVSHDSAVVHKICNRALFMEAGNLVLDAKPRQVIDLYEAKLLQKKDIQSELVEIQMLPDSNYVTSEENKEFLDITSESVQEVVINAPEVSIEFVRFLDETDQEIKVVISEQLLQISVGVLFSQYFEDPHIGFKIRERTGEVIFETNTLCMGKKIGRVESGTLLEICFKFKVPLMEGEYTITFGVADSAIGESLFQRTLVYAHNVAALKVLRNKDSILWSGIVNLSPSISIHKYTYV
ncbi:MULTISPECIES: ABC transporter ATP-binding protein [unclassified Nostoc]|uniref:ABC transporter ATP-binding protein n=1 Tax=unclassified Nostoc TaxID=2593658 RepID=UPI0025AAF4E1|nr:MULTISPECIES: ABC transporter ATP-binding protein [unclassified Nostoc]MDM9585000.1 ABC transporter ATP-binding protein [Nostoc sp. GT001]MDZ7944249.1 ABC transporter ATP-binding protein [Nostoc sp. EfeVER01]MDZ7994951.1 ABC transporter ATP-binding protein [Nostoc sp. EspVER01]